MAVADTAKLITSLELQDKFSRTADQATRKLGGLEGATQKAGRNMGVFGHAVSTALGVGLERAVSGGVRLLAGALTGGVTALNDLQLATVATNTVIASTKGVAGQTADSIRNLAEKYEGLNATIDDKVIQSGENLLLTFTNIRKDAFEPALQAALDMNQAMGGGEEGLQSTIIQVGKALQDPIKGATALRRVGVQLSDEQQKQIKILVGQNDLYGAQKIILGELSTEFGGQFAAAGKTAEGQMAALHDRVEDLQKSFAGPLIPVLDRVRSKIIEALGSPAATKAAEGLGKAIASLFSDKNVGRAGDVLTGALDKIAKFDFSKVGDGVSKVFGFLGEVPWGAIASGLQITGAATKAVVDAFLSLPKEVQGIAIAALAVNKVSGGLAGSLAGGLIGKGIDLFKGRGSTPVNPLFVSDVTGGGGLPGVGGAAGGIRGAIAGGGLIGGLATGVAVAAPVLAGIAAVEVINFDTMRNEQKAGLQGILNELPKTPAQIQTSIDKLEAQNAEQRPLLDAIIYNTNVKPQIDQQIQTLKETQAAQLHEAQTGHADFVTAVHAQQNSVINEFRQGSNARRTENNHIAALSQQALSFDRALVTSAATQISSINQQRAVGERIAARVAEGRQATQAGFSATGEKLGGANARLSGILAKKSSVTVNATIPVSVSISAVQVAYNLSHLRQTTNSGGFI